MSHYSKPLFRETQPFRESWIFPVMITTAVLMISMIVVAAALGEITPRETLILLAVFIPLNAFVIWLMCTARLETEVRKEGVYYRWASLFKKPFFIPASDVLRAEPRKIPFLQYGFHIFPTYGQIHNVKGKQGLQFRLTSGRKIFIGTQEIYNFKKAVDTIIVHQPKSIRSES